jgi:hypothetical protein
MREVLQSERLHEGAVVLSGRVVASDHEQCPHISCTCPTPDRHPAGALRVGGRGGGGVGVVGWGVVVVPVQWRQRAAAWRTATTHSGWTSTAAAARCQELAEEQHQPVGAACTYMQWRPPSSSGHLPASPS